MPTKCWRARSWTAPSCFTTTAPSPEKDLEVAQDTEAKAKVDVETAIERLHVLGADLSHPTGIIDINAPASGVITEQNVTAAAGVKTLDNSPNLFTISDLSHVWIICDVYENDLPRCTWASTPTFV